MNFDRIAPFYRGLEWLGAGEKMQRCRVVWLPELNSARNVLIAGEGPGRFLPECLRVLPQAKILCVDGSVKMLAQARQSVSKIPGAEERVTFLHATLPEWQPPAVKFDLIVTHFFLDCFAKPQLAQVIRSLASAAQPDARWVVSDFCVPERGLARWRARMVVGILYAFFQAVTNLPASELVPPPPFLVREGFRLEKRREFDHGLIYSEVWVR